MNYLKQRWLTFIFTIYEAHIISSLAENSNHSFDGVAFVFTFLFQLSVYHKNAKAL